MSHEKEYQDQEYFQAGPGSGIRVTVDSIADIHGSIHETILSLPITPWRFIMTYQGNAIPTPRSSARLSNSLPRATSSSARPTDLKTTRPGCAARHSVPC